MKRSLTILAILAGLAIATPGLSLESFVSQGVAQDQQLKESQILLQKDLLEKSALKRKAILPRLRLGMAFGPAPGIREKLDSNIVGDTVIYKTIDEYDFKNIGPYYGMELEFAQPLNLGRLYRGLDAVDRATFVKELDQVQRRADRSRELQEIFFQYQYALTMRRLALEVQKDIGKVSDKLQEQIDEGSEDVSSNDLLEIRASRFDIEDGLFRTEEGVDRAVAGMRFYLGDSTSAVVLKDTLLTQRIDTLPSWNSLKSWYLQNALELKQLEAGLKARRAALEVKRMEMGPELFIFGSLQFAKSWARDRTNINRTAFENDPLNRFEGTLGIGTRFDLNLWSRLDGVRSSEYDLRALETKSNYAQEGLLLRLSEAYQQVRMHQRRIKAAEDAFKASEALLKSAALAYDMDPSEGRRLLSAYQKNVSNRKTFIGTILDYNLAFAKFIAKTGLELDEYRRVFGNFNTTP